MKDWSGEIAGNYLSIIIGGNKFAFYKHLKPNSIKLKPGQKVKKEMLSPHSAFQGREQARICTSM